MIDLECWQQSALINFTICRWQSTRTGRLRWRSAHLQTVVQQADQTGTMTDRLPSSDSYQLLHAPLLPTKWRARRSHCIPPYLQKSSTSRWRRSTLKASQTTDVRCLLRCWESLLGDDKYAHMNEYTMGTLYCTVLYCTELYLHALVLLFMIWIMYSDLFGRLGGCLMGLLYYVNHIYGRCVFKICKEVGNVSHVLFYKVP